MGDLPLCNEVLVMQHENTPLPVCNFCDQEYDPFDRHTCAGNNIEPATTREVVGLTRQQIGEALDELRKGGHSPLQHQAGGDHYRKLAIQPVEYIIANDLGFLAGNVIKYATRYKDKGGAEDIRKIKHYCDLILEFEYKEE